MAQDKKYGNISIPGIPDDEPVFIIRAKDKASPDAIEAYADFAADYGATKEFVHGVYSRTDEFHAWQRANADKVKVPD